MRSKKIRETQHPKQGHVKSDKEPPLAKTTPPLLVNIYERGRAFRHLDRARKRPIVWLSAPAGSGKTTLVASYLRARGLPALWYQMDASDNDVASFFYFMGLAARAVASAHRQPLALLTPESRAGLSIFTTNFFRDLFERLKRPGIVVLDNYQEVAVEGQIQEVMELGLDQIPSGINVIVTSREATPGALARLRVRDRIEVLDWEDLKLIEEESTGVIRLRQQGALLTREQIKYLHKSTQGWVAGLVLLADQAEQGFGEPPDFPAPASQSIFDYFANEIFRHSDKKTQSFLLKTAYLPKIAVSTAQEIAEETNAPAILNDLTKRNFFTVRRADGSYEYHPLFRDFLVTQVNVLYTADHVKALKHRSAQALAEHGEVETAISLLQQAQDWQAALTLVLQYARTLVAQGRTQTVEAWLNEFPDSFRTQNPWVWYWLGECRRELAPAEARIYFEQAFTLFEKRDDASPLYLTWARIIDSFGLERNDFTPMIRWLDVYKSLAVNRQSPTPEIEAASVFVYINGLINARSDHTDLVLYAERAERLFQKETNENRRFTQAIILNSYYLMMGDYPKVLHLLARLAPTINTSNLRPIVRLHWYMWKVLVASLTGAVDESLRATTDCLALADDSGIHLFDHQVLGYGIWGQLCAGNIALARALLQQMSRLPNDGQIREGIYRQHASLVFLHEDDVVQAMAEGRRALDLAKGGGDVINVVVCTLNLAFLYASEGNVDAAIATIAEVRQKALGMNSKVFMHFCALCEANIYRLQGEQERSLIALREALAIAQETNRVTPAFCPRNTAAILYAMALDAGIFPDYVCSVIAKTRLLPAPQCRSENWPWTVRLYTLGRFAVIKDGVPLIATGKAQKKPLELLRAAIVLGGRDVSITKLIRMLWPEANHDLARNTFRITLLRLRQLIGEDSILLRESHLTLNPEHCWLDIWAFKEMLDDVREVKSFVVLADNVTRLLNLYQSAFLPNDDESWVRTQRERLRAQFLREVTRLGRELEAEGRWQEAIVLYQKGIEAESLAEEFYRHLMQCYRHLNRPAEALALYERCQKTLASALRREPSQKTKLLHAAILRGVS